MASGYSDVTNCKALGPMTVGRLTKCSHTFHLLCLLAMYCNGNKVPQRVWVGLKGPVPMALFGPTALVWCHIPIISVLGKLRQ